MKYLTDDGGNITQTINYLPYGETWVDIQSFNMIDYNLGVYLFNGKEKDSETGYNYFGARYYDSENISWLSVDPLSDKYPNLSPYAYCANNPVNLVDPDGRDVWLADKEGNPSKQVTKEDMTRKSKDVRIQTMQRMYKSGKEGKNAINQIIGSDKTYIIKEKGYLPGGQIEENGGNFVISWGDPKGGEAYGGDAMDVLTEEIFHSKQIDDGRWNWNGRNLDLEEEAKTFTTQVNPFFRRFYKPLGEDFTPTDMQIMSGEERNFGWSKRDYLDKTKNITLPTYKEYPINKFTKSTGTRNHTGIY
ncbi:MAG: RHS repeat-associated core domain-containing protein [Bacteroidales bacterium]|jgi:RHS repeat-associated protein|nr:RHS repeat-associated core domain-containing protein [Bacteroidales bacterium]